MRTDLMFMLVLLLISSVAVFSASQGLFMKVEDQGKTIPRLPPGTYRCIIVLRVDDPQPYWRLDALKNITSFLVKERIPATLGVIPFPKGMVPSDDREFHELLIKLLDEHPDLFEIAQHGLTHKMNTDFLGGSEFAGLPYDDQFMMMRMGKIVLERDLVTPKSFIPPFDTFDINTTKAAKNLGFLVISGREEYVRSLNESEFEVLVIPATISLVKDWETESLYPKHEIVGALERSCNETGLAVIETHYYHFNDPERLEFLKSILKEVKKMDNILFSRLDSLAEAIIQGRAVRENGVWVVRP